jgi:sulfur carrier protein
MTIRLNDRERVVGDAATLEVLLGELGLAERRGVAVAVNDTVVSRSSWSTRQLVENDRVLLIQATQGG